MLKKGIILILLFYMIFSLPAANSFILKVGKTNYSTADIKARIENRYVTPETLILDLAREEAVNTMGRDKAEVYKEFFGIDLKKDELYRQAPDIPEKKQQASSRALMFETWLDQKAIRIPVYILDRETLCTLLSESESYEIRREAGMEDESLFIPYTFAEIQLPEERVLASRGSAPYLTVAEYNEYVKEQYYQLLSYAGENTSLANMRNFFIARITAEKAAAEDFDLQDADLDEIGIEQIIALFVNENMFKEDLSFTSQEYTTPSAMSDAVYMHYYVTREAKLETLKKVLEGSIDPEKQSYDIRFFVRRIKLNMLKSSLAYDISEGMVYEWMEASGYRGTLRDARGAMVEEEFNSLIEDISVENEIVLNLF